MEFQKYQRKTKSPVSEKYLYRESLDSGKVLDKYCHRPYDITSILPLSPKPKTTVKWPVHQMYELSRYNTITFDSAVLDFSGFLWEAYAHVICVLPEASLPLADLVNLASESIFLGLVQLKFPQEFPV